ncbi:unnamed protein product [Tilletia laevis]|uniref:Mitochondrial import inner membrane translocase subunit TIM16 n=2 Tax=Tilletia TaxID=13289 RepID=A0A9N8LF43_9BASI|nr:hypothetical protein CF336_g3298 [Tilletia laevis]KAE8257011.1 hypothetical protein A4X03_0g4832 [Tilletia caries]CAD6908214.1 unnamed protein product [Tilletia laevis]CAD6963010.1 unnamed protein product [Tilletia caries]
MSNLPRIIGQIIFNGSLILGRAFAEAGKQAIRNARSGEAAAAAAAAAASSSSSSQSSDGSAPAGAVGADPSHALTRLHRMTLQEALLILNLKPPTDAPPRALPPLFPRTETSQASLSKVYEHLFKTNAPPAPKAAAAAAAAAKDAKAGGGQGSFYIQSKIVRARERIEAEWAAYAPKHGSSSSSTSQAASAESQTPPPSQPPPPSQ